MVSQDPPPLHQFGNQNLGVYPPDLSITTYNHQCQPHFPNTLFPLHQNVEQPRQHNNFMDLLGASETAVNNNNNHHHHHPPQKLSLSLFPNCGGTSSLTQNFPDSGEFVNSADGIGDYCISIADSKYLRPAKSLLEEVASVGGDATEVVNEKYRRRLSRGGKNESAALRSALRVEFPSNEVEAKILKLITMLEEVERRYEQYCNEMEEVVSSFEVISGKSYTTLALEAMSKHFCNLKDTIILQINTIITTPKTTSPNTWLSHLSLNFHTSETNNNSSNLQKLSLQQLGMLRQAPWRPIRGLPETSVTILRAWLFQHFLHPYPNDSDKLMLASQTGLTKNQVSNWFINARVRLWKPMIEEMYKEEFAAAESYSADESDPMFRSSSTTTTAQGLTHSAED